MRDFVVPQNTQPSVANALRQIHRHLQELGAPLLTKKQSLKAITEGTSAYFLEATTLYRYTKIKGKLYKEKVAIETLEEAEIQYSSEFA